MKKTVWFAIILIATVLRLATAQAAIKTNTVEYKEGDTVLEGYLAYDDSLKGRVPGVLIIHEWTGLGPYVKMRAEQIAKLGYVVFAADIYGKGIRPANPEEAGRQAGIYRSDRQLTRRRVAAAQAELTKLKLVDIKRLAIIGYCFGGMVALELARSGADIAGVVVFHGTLDTPTPQDAKNIKAKVLALQGGDDPVVPEEQRVAFMNEMRQGGVNWQMNLYGGAVHSFSNPASGNDPSTGIAYNKQADKRSWQAMEIFFKEIFSQEK
jgi:dienelactone hydrolase